MSLAMSSTVLRGPFVIKSVLRIAKSGFRIKLILKHPVVSALFASWFGYILWPIAYFRMSRGRSLKDPKHASQVVLCIILFIAGKSHIHRPTHDTVTANSRSRCAAGVFLFTAGTYASIKSIRDNYAAGPIKRPFTCTNTGFQFSR
jgi:hypothetical protein